MLLATTTEDFHPFTDSHKERVRLCAEAGFRPHRFWLGNRRDFPEDERMTHATLDMQRALERTLYETGRAILTSYGLFEG